MKKIQPCFVALLLVVLVSFSCKKSPAIISVGEYDGTYTRDSVTVGACTTKVVEVNSLTVNFAVNLDSMASFNLTDVAVNGGDEPYLLDYTGIKGTLTGSVSETDMWWTLMSTTDTISFTGTKK